MTRPILLVSEILGQRWDPNSLSREQMLKLRLSIGTMILEENLELARTHLGQFWLRLSDQQRSKFQSAMNTFLALNNKKRVDLTKLANCAPQVSAA